MATLAPHIEWLIPESEVTNQTGHQIKVFSFSHQQDDAVLSAWAKHFRNHYCLDTQIDLLLSGTGLSREQYLLQRKFPDSQTVPGPSIRSGDFAEILVADYMQYNLDYVVPRERYLDKTIRNESKKGSDIVGFKVISMGQPSSEDELLIFEVKAQLSGTAASTRLQVAIDDSLKDAIRIAESLNALKQQLLNRSDIFQVQLVERFQDKLDRPYVERFGAAAVLDDAVFESLTVQSSESTIREHFLLVIHGSQMMALVHELYRRAASEA